MNTRIQLQIANFYIGVINIFLSIFISGFWIFVIEKGGTGDDSIAIMIVWPMIILFFLAILNLLVFSVYVNFKRFKSKDSKAYNVKGYNTFLFVIGLIFFVIYYNVWLFILIEGLLLLFLPLFLPITVSTFLLAQLYYFLSKINSTKVLVYVILTSLIIASIITFSLSLYAHNKYKFDVSEYSNELSKVDNYKEVYTSISTSEKCELEKFYLLDQDAMSIYDYFNFRTLVDGVYRGNDVKIQSHYTNDPNDLKSVFFHDQDKDLTYELNLSDNISASLLSDKYYKEIYESEPNIKQSIAIYTRNLYPKDLNELVQIFDYIYVKYPIIEKLSHYKRYKGDFVHDYYLEYLLALSNMINLEAKMKDISINNNYPAVVSSYRFNHYSTKNNVTATYIKVYNKAEDDYDTYLKLSLNNYDVCLANRLKGKKNIEIEKYIR